MNCIKFNINIDNVSPSFAEADQDSLVGLWGDVECYFKNKIIQFDDLSSVTITLDASDIKEKVNGSKDENCEAYLHNVFSEFQKNSSNGIMDLNPFGAVLSLTIESINKHSKNILENFVVRLIEQIFIAMNLASRGGCSFYGISFANIDKNYRKYSLSCDVIECAWHHSAINGWPIIKNIAFKDVWEWLESQDTRNFVLAKQPAQKAISILLSLSYKDDTDATDIVQVSQALESLLLNKSEPKARGIKRKIPSVLGDPPQGYDEWFGAFYKLRSDIVHGDYPIFRPRYFENHESYEYASSEYEHINELFTNGVSVIVAIMQDFILHNCSFYKFNEKIIVDRV